MRRLLVPLGCLLALVFAATAGAYRAPTEQELEGLKKATAEQGHGLAFSLADVRVSTDGSWATAVIEPVDPSGQPGQPANGVYRALTPPTWKLEYVNSELCFGKDLAKKRMSRAVSEDLGIKACPREAPEKIYVRRSPCGPELVYRPHDIGLSCDGTFSIVGIHWLHYGGDVATARARAYTRGCTPSCAQGRVFRPRAKLRLSNLASCEGHKVYARLHFVLSGHVPAGFSHRGTISLLPENEFGGRGC